jgi:hypothetical protein
MTIRRMVEQITSRRIHVALTIILLMMASTAVSAEKNKSNKQATVVDEGTFGIFLGGQRVATETFVIRQYPDSSTTSSQVHNEGGSRFEQTSELTLLPDGTLSHYEWKQTAPEKSSASVEPGDQVLMLYMQGPDGKNSEQSFFLTRATFMLDDYFFVTREVLLWRYWATACKQRQTGEGCDYVEQRVPVLIPRQRYSSQVYITFKGYEDLPFNGRPQRLRHFAMKTEGPEWHLWLDEKHMLVRISIPETNTEVLRQPK